MSLGTAIPNSMTAIAITEPGGPMVLKPEVRPVPRPRAGEILIRVKAAGVNRADVIQRQGNYPLPPGASDLPGLEVAGEVVAVGADVKRWHVGDSVTALTPGGGYAEYCVAPESNALPIPHGYTFTEAAAIPETFFTVWHNVFQRAGLREGETFLVHGGTSGIGTTAIQLAKAFGARIFATAGSDEKVEACRRFGADVAINYRTEDFVTAVHEATGSRGIDVILDMVGGTYIDRNFSAAATDGRIVQIATLGGAQGEINARQLMAKRLTYAGSTLRPRSFEFKGRIAAELEAKVWPLLASRQISPVMDTIFPLREAWRAHERMEEGRHIGKIVLDVA